MGISLRGRTLVLTAALPLVLGFAPASASLPIGETVLAENMSLVGGLPETSVIAVEFATDEPTLYASTLTGIRTYDISDPTQPVLQGVLPMAFFQNENVKLGEREDGTKLLLVGYDLFGVSPTAEPTDVGTTNEFLVVDVTDRTDPTITARVQTETRTHTMGCANPECTHALTSGSNGQFEVYDLTDLEHPEQVAVVDGPQGPNESFSSGIGHDWDVDDAGVAWWVGTGGIVAYDVSDPTDPTILNTSDHHSIDPQWNNYVSHNSQRPNAAAFGENDEEDEDDEEERRGPPTDRPGQGPGDRPGNGPGDRPGQGPGDRPGQGLAGGPGQADGAGGATTADEDVDGAQAVTSAGQEPDVTAGNVLYVTEEDLSDEFCDDTVGGFQTWHVPELDPSVNPDGEPEAGTITPLDQWTTELASDPAAQLPAAAFCSGHYFDTHDSGIVAQGWYQQGLRILDPRDPHEIIQIGYYITGAQETWGARWVPAYDEDGVQTGELTNLLYTEDPTRGMEILEVDLPEEGEQMAAVEAPILPQWRAGSPDLAARAQASEWSGACVLPPGSA